jgi:hypothetical protein
MPVATLRVAHRRAVQQAFLCLAWEREQLKHAKYIIPAINISDFARNRGG